jgi:hypothetical protein
MDAVEVLARFDAQGKVTPLRFSWQGQEFEIESTGRRWQAEDGLHILVMTPGGRMFELLLLASEFRWYLSRVGQDRMLA